MAAPRRLERRGRERAVGVHCHVGDDAVAVGVPVMDPSWVAASGQRKTGIRSQWLSIQVARSRIQESL